MELSNAQIQKQLEVMVTGMPKELAARRAYCYDCNTFVNDRYFHSAKFDTPHKFVGLKELTGSHTFQESKNSEPWTPSPSEENIALFKKALELKSQGLTVQQIADKLGVKFAKVHYILYAPQYKNLALTEVASRKKSHKSHKHLSVIGADVPVNSSTPESEWHSGFATASVRYWLQDYAKENGLELSTLTDSVVQNLKGR